MTGESFSSQWRYYRVYSRIYSFVVSSYIGDLKKLSVIVKPPFIARTDTHIHLLTDTVYNYFCLLSLAHQCGEKSTEVNCYSIKVKIITLTNYP